MKRNEYENTEDYKKSVEIVKNFVNEILEDDVQNLKIFCFDDLTKYIGDIADPDMFLITQALYIILWGDIYNLTFENMGLWTQCSKYPFRGDTMNSFGSLMGKENKRKGKSFAFRAKYFGAEKNERLWNKIEEFHKLYHSIGNFIVIPNRGTIINGINGARANFYNKDYCEGMRDYFDWFLVAINNYQDKIMAGIDALGKFEKQLQMNPEYDPSFLRIEEWESRFFLKPFFKNGKPILLFKTPLEERLKKTTVPEDRKNRTLYYSDEEYLDLLEDYLNKSIFVINYRTREIVKFLKKVLSE